CFETSEPYDPAIHDAEFQYPPSGAGAGGELRSRHIVRPVVMRGDSVNVDEPNVSGSLSPIDQHQLWLTMKIFRTQKPVAKLTSRERRTYVVPEGHPKAHQYV